MLILILVDVQYLQNAVFSLERGSNGQIHNSSGPYHPLKKIPSAKCWIHLPLENPACYCCIWCIFNLTWDIVLLLSSNIRNFQWAKFEPRFLRWLFFKGALSGLRQFLSAKSPLKVMKNAFYFTSKAPLVLKIIEVFVLTFWSCSKTAW